MKRLFLLLLCFFCFGCGTDADAQWSAPELVETNTFTDTTFTTIERVRLALNKDKIHLIFGRALPTKWSLPTDIFHTTKSRNGVGTTWSTPLPVAVTPFPSTSASITLDTNGVAHVVWGDAIMIPDSPSRWLTRLLYVNNSAGAWSMPDTLVQYPETNSPLGSQVDFIGKVTVDSRNRLCFPFRNIISLNPFDSITTLYARRDNGRWQFKSITNVIDPTELCIPIYDDTIRIVTIGGQRIAGDLNSIFTHRSNNDGASWSNRQLVNGSGRNAGFFPQMFQDKKRRLHIIWQKDLTGDLFPETVWHCYSDDGGNTWTQPVSVAPSIQGNFHSYVNAIIDNNGGLHLVFLVAPTFTSPEPSRLYYLNWNGSRWSDTVRLATGGIFSYDIAVDDNRQVHVAWCGYSGNLIPRGSGMSRQGGIYYMTRDIATSSAPEAVSGKPQSFQLAQNYPNPFNPSTIISYQLPISSDVKLVVYDVLGREVQTLVNARQAAGRYQAPFNAQGLASGVYFYRLSASPSSSQAGAFIETKKMMLVK
jgi:hypothetical protein